MLITPKIMCKETLHKPRLISLWFYMYLRNLYHHSLRRGGKRLQNAYCSGEEASIENKGRTNFQVNRNQTKMVTSLNEPGKAHPHSCHACFCTLYPLLFFYPVRRTEGPNKALSPPQHLPWLTTWFGILSSRNCSVDIVSPCTLHLLGLRPTWQALSHLVLHSLIHLSWASVAWLVVTGWTENGQKSTAGHTKESEIREGTNIQVYFF